MTAPVRVGTPTAGVDIPSGGSLTRTGVALGSALLVGVNSSVALTSVTHNGSPITPVATATNGDTGWSAYFYLILNAVAGSHTFAVTPSATGEVGIQFIDEWANLYSATVDVTKTDGSYGTLYGVGSVGPFAVTPELLVLCIGNVHSTITASTLPTQGGTWTSGGIGYVGPGGYAMATLVTSATTAISPAFSGDTVNYEGMNFAVAIKPGAPLPAATLTSPSESTPTSVGATVTCVTDSGAGTLYAVGYVGSTPTDTQIIAGQDSTGAATAAGSTTVGATGSVSVQLLNGASNTTYHYAFCQVNTGGNSNVLVGGSTFTTLPPMPTITSLSSTSPAEGSVLTINGAHYHASQTTGSVYIGGVLQPVLSWADGIITVTVTVAGIKFGTYNLVVTNSDGLSVTQSVALSPPTGWAYLTLGQPNSDPTKRMTCVPEFAFGWQLAYDTKGGYFGARTDASFFYDPVNAGSTTSAKAWAPHMGWGRVSTQTLG